MSAVIYNLDDSYDLELQVFAYAQDYNSVKFFSVRKPRIANLECAIQVPFDTAFDEFEGRTALWEGDFPQTLILNVGRRMPEEQWLESLASLFPDALRVIVTQASIDTIPPAPCYLHIRQSDTLLAPEAHTATFYTLMAVHDFVTSEAITPMGRGIFRLRGFQAASIYGHVLSLEVDTDAFPRAQDSLKELPSQARIAQLQEVKDSVSYWLDSENTLWQSRIHQLRDSALQLHEKADGYQPRPPSRLGTFSEIAEIDQNDLVSSGAVEQKALDTVLGSKLHLCEVLEPPLFVSGFSAGKQTHPNVYQDYLRSTRARFIPGLQDFLDAAGRIISRVSRERRERLHNYENESIRGLHDELTKGDKCDSEQLSKMVSELSNTASGIEQHLREIAAEDDDNELFDAGDADLAMIQQDYVQSYQAAAKLASWYWLLALALLVLALSSIPVVERLMHDSGSYFPLDYIYLATLVTFTVAGLTFSAWRIRAKTREASAQYAATLVQEFQRKDIALCQFVRYLLMSASLRKISLIINELNRVVATQKALIDQASRIFELVSHVAVRSSSKVLTQPLMPKEWERQLRHNALPTPTSKPGLCLLTIYDAEKKIAIVQFPCHLIASEKQALLIGKLEHAIPR